MSKPEVQQLRERVAELEEALADEKAASVVRLHLSQEDKQEMVARLIEHYEQTGRFTYLERVPQPPPGTVHKVLAMIATVLVCAGVLAALMLFAIYLPI